MAKQNIIINENELKRIISESINKVLQNTIKESYSPIAQKVADFIIQNWIDEIDETTSRSTVEDMIQEAYFEVFNEEIDYSNKMLYKEVMKILRDYIFNN